MHKVLLVLMACSLGCAVWAADAPAPAAPLPPTKLNAQDGAEMVLIPAGEFLMGSSEAEIAAWLQANLDYDRELFADEQLQHKVYLDAYYMYKTEVTVAQYRKFCKATKRAMPEEPAWKWQDTHPMVNVTWNDAKAYADWAGVTLPTEAQWEKAARGGDERLYSWGNAWPPPPKSGNCADETFRKELGDNWPFIAGYADGFVNTSPVGSFTANPFGVHDLAGNVWEWCADWYGADYYKTAPLKNPIGPAKGVWRVLRGGSWNNSGPGYFRCALRSLNTPSGRNDYFGFRCVVRSP